jgi:hypothetical protein
MPWKLSIEFGGLCMFVQRKSSTESTGLFVLMPVMPGMKHEPVLEFGEGNNKLRVPLDGWEVDLTSLADHGSTASKLERMANASNYVGESVDEKFLSGKVGDCLAARIVLPYGSDVDTSNKISGKMKVDKPGATQEILVGLAQVEFEVKDDSKHRILIAGATLFRGRDEKKVSIRMVNVMPDDLDNPVTKPHKKKDKVPHFPAYYRMLKAGCPNGKGPDLLVDCDADSSGECQDRFTQPEVLFVDPYNCTIGSGCKPGVLHC